MDPENALFHDLARGLGISMPDLLAWLCGCARALPSVVLVPAFGLASVPAPVRAGLALALGVGIAPSIRPEFVARGSWLAGLAFEAARGLPVAISAAAALYVASMVGGVLDDLRGVHEKTALGNVEQGTSPSGALLAMLAAVAFLETGGAARIGRALLAPRLELSSALGRVVLELTQGIELAIAVAAPLIAASVVVEVGGALVARAAAPANVQNLLAPLRSLALLGIAALLLDRITALLAVIAGQAPLS